jgi:hypothetical protein
MVPATCSRTGNGSPRSTTRRSASPTASASGSRLATAAASTGATRCSTSGPGRATPSTKGSRPTRTSSMFVSRGSSERAVPGARPVVGHASARRRATSGGSTPTRTSRWTIVTSCLNGAFELELHLRGVPLHRLAEVFCAETIGLVAGSSRPGVGRRRPSIRGTRATTPPGEVERTEAERSALGFRAQAPLGEEEPHPPAQESMGADPAEVDQRASPAATWWKACFAAMRRS